MSSQDFDHVPPALKEQMLASIQEKTGGVIVCIFDVSFVSEYSVSY